MRILNTEEAAIIAIKEKRLAKKLEVTGIEYRQLFPRATICMLQKNDELIIGISMRGKGEKDLPVIGERVSFVRALNQMAQ